MNKLIDKNVNDIDAIKCSLNLARNLCLLLNIIDGFGYFHFSYRNLQEDNLLPEQLMIDNQTCQLYAYFPILYMKEISSVK